MALKLIIDNIIYSLQNSGGISVVWYELSKRLLAEKSLNIKFIDNLCSKNIFRQLLNIPVNQCYNTNFQFTKLSRYLDIRCSQINEPFIFHSTYYRVSSNPKAVNITTVHDFTYEYFATGLKKFIHCRQKYKAIRNSDHVICISNNTKRDLLKFVPDFPENKIIVIYNGVSDEYYPLQKEDIGNFHFKYKDYLLFVGAREGYKNFDFLVHSINNSKYNLIIVGPNLNDNELHLLKAELGERWFYAGRLSNNELNRYYNGAFALIYPSSYEGFGIPVLEAQKAGCPVIALNSSSIPEIIGDKSLLINTLDKTELLSKLDLLKNEEQRKFIIEKGLLNAKKFSWDITYKHTLEVYKKIVK